jgi:methylthioribulose-1-phosphate dehydratase
MTRNDFTKRKYTSEDPKTLICHLCHNFYDLGWVTGSGGGMSIKIGDKVYVAPSGVQKEDLIVQDVFTLSAADKDVIVEAPATPGLKQSACTPLWYEVFKHRPTACSVIHTHSMNAQLATLLDGDKAKEFRITHFEMLKGVGGHGYEDELVVPIIDNRPTEDLLAEQLGEAIKNYPKANAVLVRRHGLYVWGDSWKDAKIHAECYDYLFETALKARQMGVDVTVKPKFSTYHPSTNEIKSKKRKTEVDE